MFFIYYAFLLLRYYKKLLKMEGPNFSQEKCK